MPSIPDRQSLRTICEGLVAASNDHILHLLLENMDAQPNLYRLRSTPRQNPIAETSTAVSLDDVLRVKTRLTLEDKRRLALILAYSLIQYHTNSWLCDHWGKSRIFFFHAPTQRPDLQSPYVSTTFESRAVNVPSLDQFHKEPSILALGILLIEIELGTRIEELRTPTQSTTTNSDWYVASEISKTMDQCSVPYQKVVMSCLEVPWITAGDIGSLDNREVLEGYFRNVIDPLEKECEYLFQKTTALLS
jgi:hypothetical protein